MLNKNKNIALIVGMPWLRCGTGTVMENQIKYFRSMGLQTCFVAVPHNTRQRRSNEVWDLFAQYSDELGADNIIVATFDKKIRTGNRLGRWIKSRQNVNAMHWAMHAADVSPIPDKLVHLLEAGNIQVLLVNHIYAFQFGMRLKQQLGKLGKTVPLGLVTHDIQSHILLDNSLKNPFTRQMDSVDSLLTTEIETLKNADVLVHVSEDDKRFFESEIPDKPHVLTLPTCKDVSGVEHSFPDETRRDLLFVGSEHIGNYYALEWFFQDVQPWLGLSPVSMNIVGHVNRLVYRLNPFLYEKTKDHFHGSTRDTLPFYLQSNCVVIPMVGGRGVSVKTVEATAVGKPLVGTKYAYRGLPMQTVKEAGIRVCDDPRDFAQEILDALENPRQKIEASKRLYQALFSYQKFESSMNDVIAAGRMIEDQSLRTSMSL